MVGFIVARVALRQRNDLLALAQGMAVGMAIWGLTANFAMFLLPGLAGGIAAWVVAIGIGAGLAWREPGALRVPMSTSTIFAASAMLTFWLALAGRQLLSIADDEIHHGLAASIRAGGFPPVLPWNPSQAAPYHYGIDMLVGLLAPPAGPDLAFVNELLGAYIWTSLALVVGTSIFKLGGWVGTLALCPLLLTAGAWTLYGSPNPPSILQIPVPTEVPGVGLRTALSQVYWPSFELPLDTNIDASPPNSWRPSFPLSYVLTFIVLERIAVSRERPLTSTFTLAAVLGFVGLVDESVALIGLALWIAFELAQTFRSFNLNKRLETTPAVGEADQLNHDRWLVILRAAAGPALTIVLLAASGGVVTGLVTSSSHSGLSLVWHEDPASRRPLGELADLSGSIGLLGIGPVAVAAVAVLLARRNPLVLMLAAGSGAFLLAALTLFYEPFPADITRMDGHARNFALFALLIALGLRLSTVEAPYRHIAAVTLIALVTWPTAASPARALTLGIGRGVQLSNMSPGPREFHEWFQGRHAVRPFRSAAVANYIREHTPVDARILSPHPSAMTIATGRANASGFATLLHIIVGTGPEYKDAIQSLEPSAIRKLGVTYLHATETWATRLSDRATHWLSNPSLFEPVIRDDTDTLYRITSEFLALNIPPDSNSYESLTNLVPESSSIYISSDLDAHEALRAVATLPNVHHVGNVDRSVLHVLTELSIEPLGNLDPHLVLTSSHTAPVAFPPDSRRPIWWNESLAVYAPFGAFEPIANPPSRHFSVEISDAQLVDGQIFFTATFTDRASERWTGQDWVVIPTDKSTWRLPGQSRYDRRYEATARWFIGNLQPVHETEVHEYFYLYRFEPHTATLTIWDGVSYASIDRVDREFGAGTWALAFRLLNRNQEVALIPVLQFDLTSDGEFTYEFYEGSLDTMIAS